MFTDIVTIYNYYKDGWQRTVVKGVQWTPSIVKTASNGKIDIADVVNITIPSTIQCDKAYMPYKEYSKLSASEVILYWTLNPSDNQDIMILGDIEVDITDTYKLKNLRTDYEVHTVKSVKDNRLRARLKNIKVVTD
jgi:hypothetical protein